MTMLPPPEVREELQVRAFALIAAYLVVISKRSTRWSMTMVQVSCWSW
jgi:hypothetical protein